MQAGRQPSCHPACYRPRPETRRRARDGQRCQRPFPASQGHEPRHQRCHGSCLYPPAVSCSLRTSSVMPRLITKSGTEHATASGSVWLRHFNASLLLSPVRRCRTHAAHAPHQRLVQACAPGHPDESGFRGVEHPASQAGKLDSSPSSGKSLCPPSCPAIVRSTTAERRRMAALGKTLARIGVCWMACYSGRTVAAIIPKTAINCTGPP
jgi:hypothetical protein